MLNLLDFSHLLAAFVAWEKQQVLNRLPNHKMAGSTEPKDSVTYEAFAMTFAKKKDCAKKAYDAAIDRARQEVDLAKTRHKQELSKLDYHLAKCCSEGAKQKGSRSKDVLPAGHASVSSSMSGSETSRSTEIEDDALESPEDPFDLQKFKEAKRSYDLALQGYEKASFAMLQVQEAAWKVFVETTAQAAQELRQACIPPDIVEATTYPANFHELINVLSYTKTDLRTLLDGAGGWLWKHKSRFWECDDIDFTGSELQFQASLAKAWSRGPLCHDVNRCLYEDDATTMKQLAPYIQHFREAFRGKTDEERALKPFDGRLFRHMRLDEVIMQKYQKDSVAVWPTFSSCTYDESWLKKESWGNVTFEIRCYGAINESEGENADKFYLPCLIEKHVLPQYVYQKEVVLPPFCSFRVVNVNKAGPDSKTRIFLETMQFPSVWESIGSGKAEDFAKWARQNPDLLSLTGNDVSIVNEIAKAAVAAPLHEDGLAGFGEMMAKCAAMGAPMSEVDPATGATPVFTLAEGMAGLDKVATGAKEALGKMIRDMAKSGANLTIPCKGKKLEELVPDLVSDLEKETLLTSK